MDEIRADRLRLLMEEKRLSTVELVARLRCTDGNERVSRPTLSKLVNGSYGATPSVTVVRGLAQALGTTTDYLLGLSDEPQPGAMAFLRRYGLADEEQLLARLTEQDKELADIMRADRPDRPANSPLYLSWDTDDDHRST